MVPRHYESRSDDETYRARGFKAHQSHHRLTPTSFHVVVSEDHVSHASDHRHRHKFAELLQTHAPFVAGSSHVRRLVLRKAKPTPLLHCSHGRRRRCWRLFPRHRRPQPPVAIVTVVVLIVLVVVGGVVGTFTTIVARIFCECLRGEDGVPKNQNVRKGVLSAKQQSQPAHAVELWRQAQGVQVLGEGRVEDGEQTRLAALRTRQHRLFLLFLLPRRTRQRVRHSSAPRTAQSNSLLVAAVIWSRGGQWRCVNDLVPVPKLLHHALEQRKRVCFQARFTAQRTKQQSLRRLSVPVCGLLLVSATTDYCSDDDSADAASLRR
mmetsp:Transcript_86287/g.167208  ORF Transcript_86287/g.167208 Transcript_86287/m.167208 type:complete len:321 (-) Transcript_86287:5-967(-)